MVFKVEVFLHFSLDVVEIVGMLDSALPGINIFAILALKPPALLFAPPHVDLAQSWALEPDVILRRAKGVKHAKSNVELLPNVVQLVVSSILIPEHTGLARWHN